MSNIKIGGHNIDVEIDGWVVDLYGNMNVNLRRKPKKSKIRY